MNQLKNFAIGMISSLGFSQTIMAANTPVGLDPLLVPLINSITSIIGGVLSSITIAYLQRRWKNRHKKSEK